VSLPPFRAARSLFPYEGAAGEAIRAVKYGGAPAPAAAIANRLLADGIRGRWADLFPAGCRFCVAPVPIRPLKYLRRGFNLPTLVGGALARRAGWQFAPALLERVSETRPQAGLRVSGRQSNVAGAFRVARRVREAPAAILLLDDVYTTGATAEACAHALKRAGSQLIVVLTIARAVRTNPHAPESR
jgi:predicted amidophosphoribosyltransferase